MGIWTSKRKRKAST